MLVTPVFFLVRASLVASSPGLIIVVLFIFVITEQEKKHSSVRLGFGASMDKADSRVYLKFYYLYVVYFKI